LAGGAVRRFLFILACGALAPSIGRGAERVDYVTQVKPLLAARCYACHSALRQQSGLRLDTAALLKEGGVMGPGIEPGNADASLLIQMLTGELGVRMPPEGEGSLLTVEQIALLRTWINQGAKAPAEATPPDPRDHWAFKPPVRPAAPAVKHAAWVRRPIDAFIAAEHEARGLAPVGEASKEVLLRRVYIDLVGLPPTRDEQAAFAADASPEAYERVVDRLLASPQYGERWGRHWMDVWRYSDWAGYKDEIRHSMRHIWRWRDWIVESLNADKGYDRMVEEMLAGDELTPTDSDTLRATGFLARNWYRYNRNTWLDSTVEHTAKAFLGVTMNCCRCHDHKYDPVGQQEYYALRAVFEPHDVRTDRVAGQSDVSQDGLPRAYDAKPEEPTYVFVRGDEKRPDQENRVAPGVPTALGGTFAVEAVDLPVEAYYPALRADVVDEELGRSRQAVAEAEAQLAAARTEAARLTKAGVTAPPAVTAAAELAWRRAATARAGYAALAARVAAERAKHGLAPGSDQAALALVAGNAERELALCAAQEQQLAAEQERAAAQAALKPGDEPTQMALAAAEKKVADAGAAIAAAHGALAEASSNYQPLGEVFPAQSTGRRLALSRWIVARQNPLAARVAVNHIWLRHFGAPLVDNMFDFGVRSTAARNQPLLDWLAVELMEHGWQMKHIHRLLVTSAAYRMSSASGGATAAQLAVDPDNRYLWRMNSRRLEAEAVRDGLLHLAGKLDLTRGGPDIDYELAQTTPRRSLYLRHAYEKQARFLELFDGASVNECYRRSESVVPQQALALANSDLSIAQSRTLATKLYVDVASNPTAAGDRDGAFIALAFEHVLCRKPTPDEANECRQFLASQAELLRQPATLTAFAEAEQVAVKASVDPMERARESLVHVLCNHNDFLTVR